MNKEFMVMLVDAVVSIALFFVGKYGGENLFLDIKFLIAILQPLVLAWLASNAFVKVQAMQMVQAMGDEERAMQAVEKFMNK